MSTPAAPNSTPAALQPAARVSGLARNFIFQGIAQLATYIVTLTIMPLVVKTAGAGVYGGFVVLNSLILLTVQALTLGAGYRCRRQLPATATAVERAEIFAPNASFQLLMHLVGALVILAILPLLDIFFFAGQHPFQAAVVLPLVLSIYLSNLADDYFRYTHRVSVASATAGARAVLYPLFAIGWALSPGGLTVTRLFVAQTVATLLPSFVAWWLIAREVPLQFRLGTAVQYRWDIKYGFPLVSAMLLENLLVASDRYILTGFLSPTHVGAYAVACALGSLILVFPKIATSVLPAEMSRSVDQGRTHEAEALLNKVLQGYLLAAIPFIAGAAMLAEPLLRMLGNAEVASLGRWVVPLVAISSTIYGYTYFVFNTLFVQMDTRLWLKANGAAAVVSVTLNVIAIGLFRRIEIAAMTAILGYAVSVLIIELSRSRSWHIALDYTVITKVVAATAAMILVLFAMERIPSVVGSLVWGTIARVAVGGVTYWLAVELAGIRVREYFRFRR